MFLVGFIFDVGSRLPPSPSLRRDRFRLRRLRRDKLQLALDPMLSNTGQLTTLRYRVIKEMGRWSATGLLSQHLGDLIAQFGDFGP